MNIDANMKRKIAIIMLLVFEASISAHACQPPPEGIFASTEQRVKERYELAESIVLATMVDVVMIDEPDRHGNTVRKGERVTFRIDRVFKGKSNLGDKIVVESIGMCDYSVTGNAALKTIWSYDGGVIIPPRQWLFYRPPGYNVRIGETDLARPINEVGFDLTLLERWSKQSPK